MFWLSLIPIVEDFALRPPEKRIWSGDTWSDYRTCTSDCTPFRNKKRGTRYQDKTPKISTLAAKHSYYAVL